MFLTALPLLSALLLALFWYVYLRLRAHSLLHFHSSTMASNVILFFLFHPPITQYTGDMFNCQTYDDTSRLYRDLHQHMAFYVALPSFAMWGLGITFYAIVILTKLRERLDAADTKQGFLYNGYKRNCYFWESVLMYRKIMLIVIAAVLKTVGI